MRRKQAKRNPPRRSRARPPEFDQAAAEKVARFVMTIFVGEVDAPLVESLGIWLDPSGFDRALCATGVKRFVRRSRPHDFPEGLPVTGDYVLVEELSRGVRVKKPLCVAMN